MSTDMSGSILRLYGDLAWLWPLWGDPTDPAGEYAVWCDSVAQWIRRYSAFAPRSLLNLGCGGGKNAFNLKKHFDVTGVDISRPMLDQARELNTECEFILGDIRSCSLGRLFDCILIDDAISHMATRADLAASFHTAYRHLRPGGAMAVGVDDTKEAFEQNRTRVSRASGHAKPGNVEVVFIENDYDPDPADDTYESTMIYLIREDGELRIEREHTHLAGLFSVETWRSALSETGFVVHEERYVEGSDEYLVFVCTKPETGAST